MLIDTHAHLNFNAYRNDTPEVICRSLDGSAGSPQVWMINVGSQYTTSKRAVEIAEKYPAGVYAAIGLHPINLETGLVKMKEDPEEIESHRREEEFDYEKYKELAKSEKVVAIGEVGLDYYWKPKTKKKLELFKQRQKDLLLKELNLAKELNLPVIFHCRMAHQDLLEVVKSEIRNPKSETNSKLQIPNSKLNGVIHCFTGTWEQAQKYMEMGLHLGFNGLVFKLNSDDIIKKTPLERILIETDCPYLTPPQEGNKRNEPIYVKYIVQRIAEIKKISYEEIVNITTKNAKELFKI